ncbi:MAG: SDR family oxidoreductase [Deltaproteobacteria bacterium]|nr:SDR family oxidoreductase [Deltaproteobacteria bacterium]MBW2444935.1 SDR family oxidoreductase [Deltaproteobacteria bacterium]
MSGRLDGKVAVITGGASGMGRSTVLRFLDEGARVVVADLNEETGAETLELARARGAGDRVCFVRTDVSQEEQVEAMISRASSEYGRLDCVFNNAGIGGAIGSTLETEVDDWDFTFAALVRSVFLGIKHGARVMVEQGSGGSIINTASVAGLSGGAGPVAYSAAKAAVINLSRATAVEFADRKIRVNAICPGGILTPLLHRGNEEPMKQRLEQLQPWPAVGQGEHIAGAALFLATEDSEFVTGQALVVDGGLTAMGPNLARRAREEQQEAAFDFVGVDKGTTGEAPVVRRVGGSSDWS